MEQPKERNLLVKGCAGLAVLLIVCLFVSILLTFLGVVPPAQPAPIF